MHFVPDGTINSSGHWPALTMTGSRLSKRRYNGCIDKLKVLLFCLNHALTRLQEWHDFMISDPKKFSSTLKRAQYHAILQTAVHSDVYTFHCNILDLLQKGGLVSTASPSGPVDIAEENREHRCVVCNASWPTYRAWAVHSFKAHGRLSAYRQLQVGNRCESCGRTFANYTKLTDMSFSSSSAMCANYGGPKTLGTTTASWWQPSGD